MGVLVGLAVHDITGRLLPHWRLTGAVQDLASHLQLAKATAVERSQYCTVSFNLALDGTTYDYAIYLDDDADLEHDAEEQVFIRVQLPSGVSLDTSQGGGDGLTFPNNDDGQPSVAFDPWGLPRNNSGGFGAGTAYLRGSRGEGWEVVVSSIGRVRMERYACPGE